MGPFHVLPSCRPAVLLLRVQHLTLAPHDRRLNTPG